MSSVINDVNSLIEPLRKGGCKHLANIIDHLLPCVAWTTETELKEELRRVLEKNAIPDDLLLKDRIRSIMKRL